MMLFLNRFPDGCFLDTAPQADADVTVVELPEEDARALAALLTLESYPVAKALASLYLAKRSSIRKIVSASEEPRGSDER